MANIKSAKKRILVNEKKNAQNTMIKSGVKTSIKKAKAAAGDEKQSEQLLSAAFSKIDKAAKTGVIHKNNAARKKAALAKSVAKSDKNN